MFEGALKNACRRSVRGEIADHDGENDRSLIVSDTKNPTAQTSTHWQNG
jgi:hypothetical protein